MTDLNALSAALNAANVITPPPPEADFWDNEARFNYQSDPMAAFRGAELLGRMPSKPGAAVTDSILGIGFETLDRDTFDPLMTVPFLAESGVKFARCQTGWMKSEPEDGVFRFQWLDDVVDSLAGVGIETWFSLSFGHRLHTPAAAYEEEWAAAAAAGRRVPGWARGWVGEVPLYHGAPAIEAWRRYVRELCRHFRGRVRRFEVWNEPEAFWCHDGRPLSSMSWSEKARDYVELVRITAETVRAEIPDAVIIAVVAQTGTVYIQELGRYKLADLIDVFSYHFYGNMPEEFMSQRVAHIKAHIKPTDPAKKLEIWQGESGRASGKSTLFSKPTELGQARYLARRYLTDLVNGAALSSFFTVTDFQCYYPDGSDQYYGVIDPGRKCGKLAYYTLQAMGWLFDGLRPAPDNLCLFRPPDRQVLGTLAPYRVEAWALRRRDRPLYALWTPEHVDLTAPTVIGTVFLQWQDFEAITNPVVIDPIRRNVWKLPPEVLEIEHHGLLGATYIRNFPVTDYPLFIADASLFDEVLG